MDKTKKIKFNLNMEERKRLFEMAKKADSGNKRSLIVQLWSNGVAKGLLLSEKDSAEVQEIIKPYWEGAEDWYTEVRYVSDRINARAG